MVGCKPHIHEHERTRKLAMCGGLVDHTTHLANVVPAITAPHGAIAMKQSIFPAALVHTHLVRALEAGDNRPSITKKYICDHKMITGARGVSRNGETACMHEREYCLH